MLVVSGEATPVRVSSPTCRQASAVTSTGQRARPRRVGAERRAEPRAGHPPRLPDRRGAAGQPHGKEHAHALEAAQVAQQQLAAPDRAVAAVARAVEDGAHGAALLPVLGKACREVRVVVLHAHQPHALERQRVLGGQVLGVEVVHHQLGLHGEQPLEVRDALAERAQRLVVLEVADVVADPRAGALGDPEGVLLLGAAGEQAGAGGRNRERQLRGHVAARAAQQLRPSGRHAHDRVVGPRLDRAVVQQEEIGDAGEPLARVLVAVGDRLVGGVAARHHERLPHVREQEVVERRVGEHHAQVRRSRRHRLRHGRRRPPAREHDRPPRRAQQLALRRLQRHQLERGAPRREPSARRACPRGACARAARPRRGRRRPGRRDGSRPAPSRRRSPRPAAPGRRPRCRPGPRPGSPARPRRARASRAGRTPDRRWAARGSAGRRGPRTRPGRPRTSRSRPSWCAAGRRGRFARS